MMSKSKVPQIRFKSFNEKWKEKKFDDVIDDLYNGQTPSRAVNSYWNGQINWLSSGELNRSIVKKAIEKITPAGQKNANLRIVPKGTFVMAITGLEASGTRGNCAILGIDTTLNQSCMAIYPNFKQFQTPFLFQWYRKNSEEYGLKFTQGTKQQSYNAEIIKKLDIVLPKVEEQAKIGNYFQQLDKLIEQKEKKHQKLKQFKKAMLNKMFPKNGADTPEIRFKGFSGKWEENELGEVVEVIMGQSPSSKSYNLNKIGIPLIQGNADIQNRLSCPRNWTTEETKECKIDDLILTVRAPVGAIAKSIHNACIGRGVCAIRNNVKSVNEFIYQFLLDYEEKWSILEQGSTFTAVSGTEIRKIKIKIPSLKEQEKIGNYFHNLDKQIDLQIKEIKKLKNIKKASLDKMFV